jgi:hypothetical protein
MRIASGWQQLGRVECTVAASLLSDRYIAPYSNLHASSCFLQQQQPSYTVQDGCQQGCRMLEQALGSMQASFWQDHHSRGWWVTATKQANSLQQRQLFAAAIWTAVGLAAAFQQFPSGAAAAGCLVLPSAWRCAMQGLSELCGEQQHVHHLHLWCYHGLLDDCASCKDRNSMAPGRVTCWCHWTGANLVAVDT